MPQPETRACFLLEPLVGVAISGILAAWLIDHHDLATTRPMMLGAAR